MKIKHKLPPFLLYISERTLYMKLPVLTSVLIFILILHHNISKGKKTREEEENAYWERDFSANHVRKGSLDDLNYISFDAEPFYLVNLLDAVSCPEFLEKNPEIKNILPRFVFLENQKIVNLTEYTNTELKFKYGIANLTLLTEYDTNYNELISLLHNYGSIFSKEGYDSQALSILEYAVSIGTDISGTYTTCAGIYQKNNQWEKLEWLKKEAEKISTSRKDSIVRKLQEFGPYNG